MRTVISALATLSILALAACDNPAPQANAEGAPKPPVPGDMGTAGSKTETTAAKKAPAKKAAADAKPAADAPGEGAAEPAKAGDLPAPPDVAAPPADAEKSKTGLASKVLAKGTGTTKPKPEDKVSVHYTGWTKDGKMFDSSVVRGEPSTFGLNGVIPGWTEGLQLMVEKEKRRFWIPADLAYGDKPSRPGAPTGQLTFDVELLGITVAPPPPEVPKDVAAPSAGAKKTASGISYKVITKGKGTEKPTADDTVLVHYSGWTKDGKMFDSSVTRGEPARFPLKRVIKGWTEGVQLMVVGEKTRFWIPADLAYGEKAKRPGGPEGQLTFDIELLEIQKKP